MVETLFQIVKLGVSQSAEIPLYQEIALKLTQLMAFTVKSYPKNGSFVFQYADFLKEQVRKSP